MAGVGGLSALLTEASPEKEARGGHGNGQARDREKAEGTSEAMKLRASYPSPDLEEGTSLRGGYMLQNGCGKEAAASVEQRAKLWGALG